MRFNRLIAPTVMALAFAACSKESTGPSAVSQRIKAAENLNQLSTMISDPAAKTAVDQAAMALNLGATITQITVTTGAAASVARPATLSTRVSADIGGGTEDWQATALQIVISNSNTSAANGTYNVIAMWKGGSDLIFVGAPSSVTSGSIGTSGTGFFGGLFTTPDQAWQATEGTASLSGSGTETVCPSFPSVPGLSCHTANFTGGFNITHSAPYTGGSNTATGSRSAVLDSRTLPGFRFTIDCAATPNHC